MYVQSGRRDVRAVEPKQSRLLDVGELHVGKRREFGGDRGQLHHRGPGKRRHRLRPQLLLLRGVQGTEVRSDMQSAYSFHSYTVTIPLRWQDAAPAHRKECAPLAGRPSYSELTCTQHRPGTISLAHLAARRIVQHSTSVLLDKQDPEALASKFAWPAAKAAYTGVEEACVIQLIRGSCLPSIWSWAQPGRQLAVWGWSPPWSRQRTCLRATGDVTDAALIVTASVV